MELAVGFAGAGTTVYHLVIENQSVLSADCWAPTRVELAVRFAGAGTTVHYLVIKNLRVQSADCWAPVRGVGCCFCLGWDHCTLNLSLLNLEHVIYKQLQINRKYTFKFVFLFHVLILKAEKQLFPPFKLLFVI